MPADGAAPSAALVEQVPLLEAGAAIPQQLHEQEAHGQQAAAADPRRASFGKRVVAKFRAHPRLCVAATCAGLTVGAIAAVPAMLGFGVGGIVGGSYAAGMMASAAASNGGAVAAGSTVAVLQSMGAAGAATSTYVAAGMGAAAVGASGTAGVEKVVDKVKKRENGQRRGAPPPVAHPVHAHHAAAAAASSPSAGSASSAVASDATHAPASATALHWDALEHKEEESKSEEKAADEGDAADFVFVSAPSSAVDAGAGAAASHARAAAVANHGHAQASVPSREDASTSTNSTTAGGGVQLGACVMCLDAARDCHIGCAHLCLCTQCANQVSLCPICRHVITHRQQLMFS